MKKTILFITLLCCISYTSLMAQEMRVKAFEETNDITARSTEYERKDSIGNTCALVKVQITTQGVTFSGSFVIETVADKVNEYWVYMGDGAKRLIVRHPNYLPLEVRFADYGIISLKGSTTYKLTIEIPYGSPIENNKLPQGEAGINVFPFLGPNLTIGYRMKSFSAELGITCGLNKTGDIYYYDVAGTIKSAYNYHALRVALRLGYTYPPSHQFFITPQVGVAYNNITGKEIKDITATNRGFMDGFGTLSATIGVKLSFNFSNQLGLCVTPEYDLGIAKNNNYNTVKKFDSMLKNWTDGFCLSVALVYKF